MRRAAALISKLRVLPLLPAVVSPETTGATAGLGGLHTDKTWLLSLSFASVVVAAATVRSTKCEGSDGLFSGPKLGWHLLSLESRQQIFFKYEKRIRELSTLEKVFDYFASTLKDGVKYMTPGDLLCALVPTYPPQGSTVERAGSLDGERHPTNLEHLHNMSTEFFKLFDFDNDGLISFREFLFLVTIIGIPEQDVRTIFSVVDIDGNGVVDYDEFSAVVNTMQTKLHVVHNAFRRGLHHESELSREGGVLLSFFGKDKKSKLQLDQFISFVSKLHTELVRMEFAYYDMEQAGTISAVDFARSLAASADLKRVDGLLQKISAMPPELSSQRISFEEFSDLHRIHRNMHKVAVGLDFLGNVSTVTTKELFSSSIKKLTDIQLTDRVLDILFFVYEAKQGGLDLHEFTDCMHRRSQLIGRRLQQYLVSVPEDS